MLRGLRSASVAIGRKASGLLVGTILGTALPRRQLSTSPRGAYLMLEISPCAPRKTKATHSTRAVAESADGRLFFIPDTQAKSFEIESDRLYRLYRNSPVHADSDSFMCGGKTMA
jgi:hypothetical protein